MVRTVLVLLLICILGTLVFSLPLVQTELAQYATKKINDEFGTNISIDRLRVSLISWDTALEGVYIEDYKQDTLFYVNELKTSILSIGNLAKGTLEFGDIDVDQLNFKLKTYYGENTTNLEVFVDKLDDGKPRAPGTPPFFLSSSNVDIKKSRFKYLDDNLEKPTILNFDSLNLKASNFQILGPDVSAGIEDMSFYSNRGLKVDQLATVFKYTKQQMRFDSLKIKTPLSELYGNLVFNYDREDFRDFLNKVNVEANFTESKVAFDEIKYNPIRVPSR